MPDMSSETLQQAGEPDTAQRKKENTVEQGASNARAADTIQPAALSDAAKADDTTPKRLVDASERKQRNMPDPNDNNNTQVQALGKFKKALDCLTWIPFYRIPV